MTEAEKLKKLEPQIVTELDLGEISVFEIQHTSKFKTKQGEEIYNELLKQFNSRKRIYCKTTPPDNYSEEKGRNLVFGGYHDTNGYHYTVVSIMQNDDNNFHFIG